MELTARLEDFAVQVANDFVSQCNGLSEDNLAKVKLRGEKSVDALIAERQEAVQAHPVGNEFWETLLEHIASGRSQSSSFLTLTSCVVNEKLDRDEHQIICEDVLKRLKPLGARCVFAGERSNIVWFIATIQPN